MQLIDCLVPIVPPGKLDAAPPKFGDDDKMPPAPCCARQYRREGSDCHGCGKVVDIGNA